MPVILPFKDKNPQISETSYIADNSAVTGDVVIGENTNIWFGVTIRADVNYVRIGKNTNIQDNSVCHVNTNKFPLIIGDDVTIGHGAILHGCTLQDKAFVGMGATVMDGAIIESDAMVAAGALVSPGIVVKTGELWSGVPAKFMRNMTEEETAYIKWSAPHYVELGKEYRKQRENNK